MNWFGTAPDELANRGWILMAKNVRSHLGSFAVSHSLKITWAALLAAPQDFSGACGDTFTLMYSSHSKLQGANGSLAKMAGFFWLFFFFVFLILLCASEQKFHLTCNATRLHYKCLKTNCVEMITNRTEESRCESRSCPPRRFPRVVFFPNAMEPVEISAFIYAFCFSSG